MGRLGSKLEEFLNWVTAMEDVLDSKDVPNDRKVPLVATKYKGRVDAWMR